MRCGPSYIQGVQRHTRFLSCLIACAMTLVCVVRIADAADRPPNMIIIFTDDQGYADLGCFGATDIKTPRIDQMAAEGMRFTDFHVAAPFCTPSRAALLTGCYPQRVSMSEATPAPWQQNAKSGRVWYPNSPEGLNPDETTIAEVLKARGYATQAIGKWHVGDNERFMPTNQGFDHYFGIPYSNDMPPVVLVQDLKVIEREVNQEKLTERYTDEAIKFIRNSADKPFFLYLAHNMPHVPLHVDEAHKGKSERGLYGDVVQVIDENVGRLLDTLKELKIDENTLVVFTSDNGPWHQRGEEGGLATPFRAGKGTAYEGGMRVPCVMRWPGKIPAGKACTELAVTFDLLPTFAKLAGGTRPTDKKIDGLDISPLMFAEAGAKTPHEVFYYYGDRRLNAVRMGKWKLKLETTLQEETLYGKYRDPESPIVEALYNLDNDPGEQKSVLKDHPKIVAKLREYADAMRQDLGDRRLNIEGKGVRPVGRIPEGASTKPVWESN